MISTYQGCHFKGQLAHTLVRGRSADSSYR